MADLVQFTPRRDRDAVANLAAFIRLCRDDLTVFGRLDWESDVWDVTEAVSDRSGHASEKMSLRFTSLDGEAMRGPFRDFAKAYLRYAYGWRPTKSHLRRLLVLRLLEATMIEMTGAVDVTRLGPEVFNRAAAVAKERYAPGTAYNLGREMAELARFLCKKHLVGTAFQWVSPLRNKVSPLNRIGVEADAARKRKLPSEAALDALPRCFLLAEEPADIILSSIAALLCTAPDRVGEVFSLPANCEVETVQDGQPRYGLQWWPEKGAAPMVKWIPPVMVDVAREAIRRLRQATHGARAIAAWYVANPEKIYLPPRLEHLREKPHLDRYDVADVLGLDENTSWAWCRRHGLDIAKRGARLTVAFPDFERAVLSTLPRSFPVADTRTGLRYDETLLVVQVNTMAVNTGTSPCMIEPVTYDNIKFGLTTSAKGTTLFSRLGFTERDGTPISVSTHQFRHWLNTMAQRGGLSQLDIAKWSGRANVHQNAVYDHMTAEEFVAMTREVTADDERLFGPLAEMAIRAPVAPAEFIRAQFPAAHVTELGFCVHDFSMLPCQQHRDCLNCEEHVCVKGDMTKTERIRGHLEIAATQLTRAEQAVAEGAMGADRWLEHHRATVERLRGLLAILDDPTVATGAIIRLTSRQTAALPDKTPPLALTPDAEVPAEIDEARLLLEEM